MSGWMEIAVRLNEPTRLAIIPTVVLPFTVVGMILTGVASWIAAAFGIELKADGPKRLFEVLMKPKILALAVLSNLAIWGGIKGVHYVMNAPYPIWWVNFQNSPAHASERSYESAKPAASAKDGAPVLGLSVVWEKELHDAGFAFPSIHGQSIFFGSDSGRILEVDALSGEKVRSFEIGQPVMVSPLIWNGKLYAGEGVHDTHHARMYSFDLRSGKLLATLPTGGHIERAAVPVTVAGANGPRAALLFPAGKDGLYLADAETLEKIWQAPIGHVDTMAVVDGTTVYVGTGQEKGFGETPMKASALDLQDGHVIWERTQATSSWGIPVVWEGKVCFSVGDVYANNHYGQLACYDGKTGENYFAFNTDGALIGQPVVKGDQLIASDLYGKIYQINLRTKTLDWTIAVPTPGKSYSSVQCDDAGHVILPGTEGLYVYSRQTQKLLFVWKPDSGWDNTFTNVVFYGDLWILGDKKGRLWALRPVQG